MLPLIDFQPDVIHAHDWQSGFVPALLKIQYAHLPFYQEIRTVFTIHNLQYQGIFGIREVQDVLGLGDSLWTDDKLECFGCANYLKSGLVYADEITTVSPSYADEIQTAYYGERLDGLLRARRGQLTGVLNARDSRKNAAAAPNVRSCRRDRIRSNAPSADASSISRIAASDAGTEAASCRTKTPSGRSPFAFQ